MYDDTERFAFMSGYSDADSSTVADAASAGEFKYVGDTGT